MTNNNNNFIFSASSEQQLNTVHKDLNILAHEVLKISPIDFSITCGYRSELYQKKLCLYIINNIIFLLYIYNTLIKYL